MSHELHPLCTLFPRLSGAEFDVLRDDIAANGLRQPIVLHEGMILDGGNRYRACIEAGVEPAFVEFTGGNLVSFVLSANLHRRHMTPGQQAAIVASAQDWAKAQPHGGDRRSDQAATLPLETVADRAAQSGASERTQRMADKVAKADPELAKKVAHGEVSLPRAAERVAPQLAARKPAQAKPKPSQAPREDDRISASDSDLQADNERLRAELTELRDLYAEQTSQFEETQEELVSLCKLVDAGDQMEEARRQIKQLQSEVRVLRERQVGLMNEAAEAKRLAKSWRTKFERLEKARA